MCRDVLIRQLGLRFPELDFELVIGADLVPTLDRWVNAVKLFEEVPFIIVPRPGADNVAFTGSAPKQFRVLEHPAEFETPTGSHRGLKLLGFEVSSTDTRNRLHNAPSVDGRARMSLGMHIIVRTQFCRSTCIIIPL